MTPSGRGECSVRGAGNPPPGCAPRRVQPGGLEAGDPLRPRSVRVQVVGEPCPGEPCVGPAPGCAQVPGPRGRRCAEPPCPRGRSPGQAPGRLDTSSGTITCPAFSEPTRGLRRGRCPLVTLSVGLRLPRGTSASSVAQRNGAHGSRCLREEGHAWTASWRPEGEEGLRRG